MIEDDNYVNLEDPKDENEVNRVKDIVRNFENKGAKKCVKYVKRSKVKLSPKSKTSKMKKSSHKTPFKSIPKSGKKDNGNDELSDDDEYLEDIKGQLKRKTKISKLVGAFENNFSSDIARYKSELRWS